MSGGINFITVEEWGVRLGDSQTVVSKGNGPWAKRHSEQEVDRIARNAKLPSTGGPVFGTVVHRTVTKYENISEWVEP